MIPGTSLLNYVFPLFFGSLYINIILKSSAEMSNQISQDIVNTRGCGFNDFISWFFLSEHLCSV